MSTDDTVIVTWRKTSEPSATDKTGVALMYLDPDDKTLKSARLTKVSINDLRATITLPDTVPVPEPAICWVGFGYMPDDTNNGFTVVANSSDFSLGSRPADKARQTIAPNSSTGSINPPQTSESKSSVASSASITLTSNNVSGTSSTVLNASASKSYTMDSTNEITPGTSIVTPSLPANSRDPNSAKSLDSRAKVAIGASSAVAGACLIGVTMFFILRTLSTRRKRQASRDEKSMPKIDVEFYKPELNNDSTRTEISGDSVIRELLGLPDVYEIEDPHNFQEKEVEPKIDSW